MPTRVLRRTPESEKAAIYGYKDLLRDSLAYISGRAGENVARMTSGKMSNEEFLEMAMSGVGGSTKFTKELTPKMLRETSAIVKKFADQGLTYDAYMNLIPDKPEFAFHQWTFRGRSPIQGDTITTKGTSLEEMERKVTSKIRDYYGDMLDFWRKKGD